MKLVKLFSPLFAFGRLRVTETKAKGVIVPSYAIQTGEKPDLAFSDLRDYYLNDPSVKAAIDYLNGQIVGPGFYLNSEDEEAKTVVEGFFEGNAFHLLLEEIVREVLYAGNSFVQMIDSPPQRLTELHQIQLSSVVRVKRDGVGKPQQVIIRVGGRERSLPSEELIHFAWNVVDRQPLGNGLLSPLARTRTDLRGKQIPSYLDGLAQIDHDLMRIAHRYPPRNVYQFEDASDQFIEEKVKPVLKDPDIEDFAVNKKLTVHDVTVKARADLGSYVDYIYNRVQTGLETPIIRLFTTPGFTEASARVAAEMAERMVIMFQRFLKHTIEKKIIVPILTQEGYDPMNPKSKVEMVWGQPDIPELHVDHILKLVELGVMTDSEARNTFRTKFGLELSEPDEPGEESDLGPPSLANLGRSRRNPW